MKKVYTLDQEKASKARKRMIITYFFAPYILIGLVYLVRVLTTSSSFVTELEELWNAFLIMPFWIVILFFINSRQKKADQAFKVELDKDSITLYQAARPRIRLEYKEITNLFISNYHLIIFFNYKMIYISKEVDNFEAFINKINVNLLKIKLMKTNFNIGLIAFSFILFLLYNQKLNFNFFSLTIASHLFFFVNIFLFFKLKNNY